MDGLRVIVQPGTGYDLLLSACIVADRLAGRRIDEASAWRRRAEAVDKGELAKAIQRIGREPWISLLGLVHALTEEPTAANAVAALEVAEPREVVLAAIGYYRRAMRVATPAAIIRAAVDGDRGAIREFRRTSYPDLPSWQATLRRLLGSPPSDVHAQVVGTLARWHEAVFAEHEATIAAAQASDGAVVRELIRQHDLDATLERIAPGLTFAREVGQSLVVLVPSVVIRPTFALTDYGSTLVIAYPAAREADANTEPPERLVRMAKALADPLRLRALRELGDGPMSITELARRLGVPRTSLQHHVPILIQAGLASLSVDDARWGNLELRDEALGEVSRLAEEWVIGRAARSNWSAPAATAPVATRGVTPAVSRKAQMPRDYEH